MQFYILAPLLFWLWTRLAARARAGERWRRRSSPAASRCRSLDPKTLGPAHVEFSLLHYFNFFWLGIVLAYFRAPLADWIAPRSGRFRHSAWLAGPGVVRRCFRRRRTPQATSEALRLPGVYLGLAAVFVSTFAPRSGFRAFCAWPWISLVGGACYSIYLVHLQVTQVVASFAAKAAPGAPLAAVVAIFVASALVVVAVGLTYYVWVERRFMTRDWHLLVWAAIKRRARRPRLRRPAEAARTGDFAVGDRQEPTPNRGAAAPRWHQTALITRFTPAAAALASRLSAARGRAAPPPRSRRGSRTSGTGAASGRCRSARPAGSAATGPTTER